MAGGSKAGEHTLGLPSVEGVYELMAQEVPRGRVAGRRQNGHEPRLGPESALRADERGWGGRISSDWGGLDGVLGGNLANADDCGAAAIGTRMIAVRQQLGWETV